MGPLQLAVTWYKIRHAGEQAVHWDIQNKATSSRQICIFFVLDVPVRSLLSSMADFVPCDRQLQRAHSRVKNLTLKLLDTCFIRISYYSGQSQPRRKQHNEPDSEFKANTCKPLLSAGKHVQCEQVTICFHSEGCLHGGRKILALGRSKKAEQLFVCFTWRRKFGRSGYQVEKEKKKNCRPLAAERPAAAMFVLFVPSTCTRFFRAKVVYMVLGSS